MALSKLTSEEFERDVENGERRVVVDFYADWCGPCHQVAPALEELSSNGKATFVSSRSTSTRTRNWHRPIASFPSPQS